MGEKDIPGFYAVGLITLLQTLPVYSILTILAKFRHAKFNLDITTGVIVVLSVLVFNSIYFLPKSRQLKVTGEIEGLTKNKFTIIKTLAIVYSLTVIALVVILLQI
ncbi:MAG: hypothetical protein C0448_09110 [Sphingobacteriaceae bacterium]|nr:hypothetical protein [Sphingobacteriaceae bacterium]